MGGDKAELWASNISVYDLKTPQAVETRAAAEGLELRRADKVSGYRDVIKGKSGPGKQTFSATNGGGGGTKSDRRLLGKITLADKLPLAEQAALVCARFQAARRHMSEQAANDAKKPYAQRIEEAAEARRREEAAREAAVLAAAEALAKAEAAKVKAWAQEERANGKKLKQAAAGSSSATIAEVAATGKPKLPVDSARVAAMAEQAAAVRHSMGEEEESALATLAHHLESLGGAAS